MPLWRGKYLSLECECLQASAYKRQCAQLFWEIYLIFLSPSQSKVYQIESSVVYESKEAVKEDFWWPAGKYLPPTIFVEGEEVNQKEKDWGLELADISVPFQPRPFCGSKNCVSAKNLPSF